MATCAYCGKPLNKYQRRWCSAHSSAHMRVKPSLASLLRPYSVTRLAMTTVMAPYGRSK
jgi:hypothetical protein